MCCSFHPGAYCKYLVYMLPWKQVVSLAKRPSEEAFCTWWLRAIQYSKSKMHFFCWEGPTHQHMLFFLLLLFFVVTRTCNTCTQGFLIGWPPSQYPRCLCVGRVLIDLLSLSGPSINLVLCKVARLFLRLVVRGGSMRRCVWERCGSAGERAWVHVWLIEIISVTVSVHNKSLQGVAKKKKSFFFYCT